MENNLMEIEISDIGLASLLVTMNHPVIRLHTNSKSKRVDFVFVKNSELTKLVSNYWANEIISVPVQTLFINQKALKNRIWAEQ